MKVQLSVSINVYGYCPGGSTVSVVFVVTVDENKSESEVLFAPIRVVSQIQHRLPEYHTRYQKGYFKQKLNNIASVKPSIVDFIYKE